MPTYLDKMRTNQLQVGQVMARLCGPEFSPAVVRNLQAHFNPDGLPFDERQCALDAAPLSQIKKIVNAIYHVEQTAQEADARRFLNVQYIHFDFLESLGKTSLQHHLYQALYLLTHVDVDFQNLFRQEFAGLMSFFSSLQATALSCVTTSTSDYMGTLTGHGVTNLSQMDYLSLMQFVQLLPNYLAYIKNRVDSFATDEAPVGAVMEPAAILQWFEGLEVGGINLSNNRIYLHFVRPFLATHIEILNECSHLKGASVHVIQEKLRTSQDLFSRLVACVDALEVQLALRPGQLSNRLLHVLRPMHQNVVDYYLELELGLEIDADLLRLEGPNFNTIRLDQAFRRWAEETLACQHMKDVVAQCNRFFDALSAHDALTRLSQLDDNVKQPLIESFRLIQPYLATMDIKLSNVIAKSLTEREEPGYFDGLYSWTVVRQITDYPDRIEMILKGRDKLHDNVIKILNTNKFRQRLNQNFIDQHAMETPDMTAGLFFAPYRDALRMVRDERAARPVALAPEPLVQDLDAERRATCVLKTTTLSTTVANLRQQMAGALEILHPAVQCQLQAMKKNGSPPFPEIITDYAYLGTKESIKELAQPTQLLGFKKLANALYFLEESCKKLEGLNEWDSEKHYIFKCYKAYQYAYLAAEKMMALQDEPYYLMLSNELRLALNASVAQLLALKRDYIPDDGWDLELVRLREGDSLGLFDQQPPPEAPNHPPTLVQRGDSYWIYGNTDGSSWRLTPLDATVVPHAQINFEDSYLPYDRRCYALYQEITLKNAHTTQPGLRTSFLMANALTLPPLQANAGLQRLDEETVDAAHVAARELAEGIYQLLGCNSVAALLRNTPTGLALLDKVNVLFCALRDSSRTGLNHVDVIQRDHLVPFLLAVDQWEDQWGLKPGLLSQPIKQRLDAYYQGLLKPLELSANHHIALATNTDDFTRRTDAATQRFNAAESRLVELKEMKSRLDGYYTGRFLNYFYDQNNDPTFAQDILPILEQGRPACTALYDTADMANISNLRVAGADLEGQIAYQQLILEVAEGKIRYLQAQLVEQLPLNRAFKRNYVLESLHRQLQPFKSGGAAYDGALSRYVEGLLDFVFAGVEGAEDINRAVGMMLIEQVIRFGEEQGHYYRKLDAIQHAVEQMKAYMVVQQAELYLNAHQRLSSGFENQDTLGAKRALIEEIEAALIEQQALPGQAPFDGIQAIIARDDFKTTLLAYAHYDAFTYGWLVQCVTLFLEWICLYKPEPKVAYERLTQEAGFFRAPPAPDPVDGLPEERQGAFVI